MKKEKKEKPNWTDLRSEWLLTNQTLNDFRIGKALPLRTFYAYVKKGKWVEERLKIESKVSIKLSNEIVKAKADQWKSQLDLWEKVENLCHKYVDRLNELNDGKVKPISPYALNAMASAVSQALQGQKLLIGEPTDHLRTENYHLAIVQMLKAKKEGRLKFSDFKNNEDNNTRSD